ncbi:hypothetical protein M406DRAFT_332013 [Cryphonectria parasitica EP155]|uniref:Uncharacterized protein n=1 Tax=Cryphonectria parasitica (strain ATCC 38755 / EP155) TaxID=660469 RepID=A0A9P5CMQ9_CRYP1|nr:uncharacterized protein M406DRAFT_332013 [Cryphonectria parasitica EP155]KAF3763517.1 hypothetical protein M406DRAFT_332013 [Cryphonectria parasitica EP155]
MTPDSEASQGSPERPVSMTPPQAQSSQDKLTTRRRAIPCEACLKRELQHLEDPYYGMIYKGQPSNQYSLSRCYAAIEPNKSLEKNTKACTQYTGSSKKAKYTFQRIIMS